MTRSQYEERVRGVTIEDTKSFLRRETICSWSGINEEIVNPYAMAILNLLGNDGFPACKVGSTVYIAKEGRVIEGKVKSIVIKDGEIDYWYEVKGCVGEKKFASESVGKEAFFNREDAYASTMDGLNKNE